MNKARVYIHDVFAGILEKFDNEKYRFIYEKNYRGPPVSLTIPVKNGQYYYDRFPSFFDAFLPEGEGLAAFLHKFKLDEKDYFGQLLIAGRQAVGAVTIVGME